MSKERQYTSANDWAAKQQAEDILDALNGEEGPLFQMLGAVAADRIKYISPETIQFVEEYADKFQYRGSRRKKLLLYLPPIVEALKIAGMSCRSVRVSRRNKDTTKVQRDILDHISDEGDLCLQFKAKPGSPWQTRLLPNFIILALPDPKPKDLERQENQPVVGLFARKKIDGKRQPLPFNPTDTEPRRIAKKLERINEINAGFKIRYQQYCPWNEEFLGKKILVAPMMRAQFFDSWELHGRMYTSTQFGQQSLPKQNRRSITFNGMPSVEKDFVAMHPRILYALEGIDYRPDDPYALWDDATTPDQRFLAKLSLNTAFNAATRHAAISACNYKKRKTTKTGKAKTGKQRAKMKKINRTLKETGLTFAKIYDLAKRKHEPIAHQFGNDAGIKLMRTDSKIALDVMYRFAKIGIPILGIHDSFIVPAIHADRLISVMEKCYEKHVGFLPEIK